MDPLLLSIYLAAGVPRELWDGDDRDAAWMWMLKSPDDSEHDAVDYGVKSSRKAYFEIIERRGETPTSGWRGPIPDPQDRTRTSVTGCGTSAASMWGA